MSPKKKAWKTGEEMEHEYQELQHTLRMDRDQKQFEHDNKRQDAEHRMGLFTIYGLPVILGILYFGYLIDRWLAGDIENVQSTFVGGLGFIGGQNMPAYIRFYGRSK
jgi:hypothetical protein